MNDIMIYKDNRVIEASYQLSKVEQRIILFAIGKLNPQKNERTLSFYVNEFHSMFPDMGTGTVHEQLIKATKSLYNRSISIKTDNIEGMMRWVSSAFYYKKEAKIDVNFTPEILPYLVKLEQQFTKYQLINIAKFKSQHSIRLYELLVQYRKIGVRNMSIAELKTYLALQDKYPTTKSFNHLLLKPCISEINQHSDLFISFETTKNGREIVGYKFTITSENQISLIEKDASDVNADEQTHKKILKLLTAIQEKLISLNKNDVNMLIGMNKLYQNQKTFKSITKKQSLYLNSIFTKTRV